ncbi:MAG: tRNA preQ1(34) S-adenosylmethionine ribosyltransferase-isomerase QueA [Candidatus Acidiferrum sp.]
MLVLNRTSVEVHDRQFFEFPELLDGDELLVYNNARVIPARLYGKRAGMHAQVPSKAAAREHLQGRVEVFLVRRIDAASWEALVRPGRKLPVGERVIFGAGELEAEITGRGELGLRTIRFSVPTGCSVESKIEALGHVPLPPYIERQDDVSDRSRYQTIFAKNPGAVAAPTAGLHFTPEILAAIRARGAETCELTLDVGLGTFQPIHVEDLKDHVMHGERYEISSEVAAQISSAKRSGRRIVAVGTTVVRALEDAAMRAAKGNTGAVLAPGEAEARLFITPGFRFRVVDELLTNFHLPRSTLLALVCALAGKENTLRAYEHAVDSGYRFYSYGDCMFIHTSKDK